jgi:hypothetical protein
MSSLVWCCWAAPLPFVAPLPPNWLPSKALSFQLLIPHCACWGSCNLLLGFTNRDCSLSSQPFAWYTSSSAQAQKGGMLTDSALGSGTAAARASPAPPGTLLLLSVADCVLSAAGPRVLGPCTPEVKQFACRPQLQGQEILPQVLRTVH